MKKKYIILVILLVVTALISVPVATFIKDFYDVGKIKHEVENTIKLLNEDVNLEKIKKEYSKNLTSGNNLIIEKSIEEYLIYILGEIYELNQIESYLKNTEVISIDNLELLEQYKDKVEIVKSNINGIDVDSYIKSKTNNKKVIKKYNKLIKNRIDLNTYIALSDTLSISIDKVISIVSFLKSNEGKYEITDNIIVFLNRNVYKMYEAIVNEITDEYILNLYDYKLIDDTEGPVIEARNISIVKGTKYDLYSDIKCVDSVDDVVECKVDGTYNVNVVGTYKIKISATDLSNNTSKKEVTIKVTEPQRPQGDYYITIIRNHNTVVVYGLDNNGDYTKIVKVFPASVGAGNNTPLGTFKTTKGLAWGSLYGGVWGQYSTRIVGNILFHSVPYFDVDKSTLWWQEYNNLGTARSMGCIRLTVRDAKWIYDNCPSGTTVRIYDGDLPDGVTKPSTQKIDENSPYRGWDPTDPDPNNPWN